MKFNAGELADSLALDHLTDASQTFVPWFAKSERNRLFMPTKSDTVENLLGLEYAPAEPTDSIDGHAHRLDGDDRRVSRRSKADWTASVVSLAAAYALARHAFTAAKMAP